MKKFGFLVLAVMIAVAGFVGGMSFERGRLETAWGATPEQLKTIFSGTTLDAEIDTTLYSRVWNLLQTSYVHKPVSDTDLFYGSLSGMVSGIGDPYTVFFKPKEAEKFTTDLSGKFYGIGAEIGIKKEQLLVIAPLPETPAERAGLKSGDLLLSIDGTDTFGMSVEAAVDKIRGKKGTNVVLTIYREGAKDKQDITIMRDEIKIKSVKWEIADGIATISIAQFGADTAPLFAQALEDARKQNVKGYLIDLRNNPGGFLDTSVTMASQWIKEGIIVREKFNDGSEETYARAGDLKLLGKPTVVLVNGYSASASEILAGALQDFGVATIIGEKTYGKGSVQTIEDLPDGSAVKITVAEWYTPKGRSINKQGIVPDIDLKRGDDPKKDEQKDKALEVLKEKIK